MSVIQELKLPKLPEPLPVEVYDSHTHLQTTQEVSGLPVADSIRLAGEVNMTGMVDIGCDVPSSEAAIQVAETYPQVAASVSIHPNDAARIELADGRAALDREIDRIGELANHPRVLGIGETGLDYYRTTDVAGHQAQAHSFARHIELARENDLTLVIHDREAHEDILRVLDDQPSPNRVVMHCFSGGPDFARQCLERDYWLSFPGVVTFKNAEYLRAALRITPLDKMLVETDAPYLTAMPNRGKPNSVYLVPPLVRFIAAELDVELTELCHQLRENCVAAFGKDWVKDV